MKEDANLVVFTYGILTKNLRSYCTTFSQVRSYPDLTLSFATPCGGLKSGQDLTGGNWSGTEAEEGKGRRSSFRVIR